jgi:excisionase family DNA binding protein
VTQGDNKKKPRYMTVAEVMTDMAVSRTTVINLIYAGEMAAIKTSGGPRAEFRIARESYEAMCRRREAEFAARLGGDAA